MDVARGGARYFLASSGSAAYCVCLCEISGSFSRPFRCTSVLLTPSEDDQTQKTAEKDGSLCIQREEEGFQLEGGSARVFLSVSERMGRKCHCRPRSMSRSGPFRLLAPRVQDRMATAKVKKQAQRVRDQNGQGCVYERVVVGKQEHEREKRDFYKREAGSNEGRREQWPR